MNPANLRLPNRPPHFARQVWLLTCRSVRTIFRQKENWVTSLFISMFFYLVNDASVGRVLHFIPGMEQIDPVGLVLSTSVLSFCFNAMAGLEAVRDCTNGYFDKLAICPVSRSALLLGLLLGGSLFMLVELALLLFVTFCIGLKLALGFWSVMIVLGFALLLHLGYSAFLVGVAFRTGNAGATHAATMIFFPLCFLTNGNFPMEVLKGWFKVAATINPVTYILRAIRSALLVGWEPEVLLTALLVACGFALISFGFALWSLAARTQQK